MKTEYEYFKMNRVTLFLWKRILIKNVKTPDNVNKVNYKCIFQYATSCFFLTLSICFLSKEQRMALLDIPSKNTHVPWKLTLPPARGMYHADLWNGGKEKLSFHFECAVSNAQKAVAQYLPGIYNLPNEEMAQNWPIATIVSLLVCDVPLLLYTGLFEMHDTMCIRWFHND